MIASLFVLYLNQPFNFAHFLPTFKIMIKALNRYNRGEFTFLQPGPPLFL